MSSRAAPLLPRPGNGSDGGTASWRTSLGESGVLGFVLGAIKDEGAFKPLKIHSLRLIGNAVADTGSNDPGATPAEGIELTGVRCEP